MEEKCLTCRYFKWLVGIGLGARCENVENKNAEWAKDNRPGIGVLVPSRNHVCKHYEKKEGLNEDTSSE